jgi:hypothetical protein
MDSTTQYDAQQGKRHCPRCGSRGHEVSARTIRHHIRQPWLWQATGGRYFHCGNADCDWVYWGEDGAAIPRSSLREDASRDDLLCYCFGVTRGDLSADPAVREFLVSQTREKQCACEVRNPAGRCCLSLLPASTEP